MGSDDTERHSHGRLEDKGKCYSAGISTERHSSKLDNGLVFGHRLGRGLHGRQLTETSCRPSEEAPSGWSGDAPEDRQMLEWRAMTS